MNKNKRLPRGAKGIGRATRDRRGDTARWGVRISWPASHLTAVFHKKKRIKNNFDIMQYTPEQVQEAFEKQLDGRPPYFVWEDLPPTKVWYDATDNCFHTSVGISQEFEGYELDEVCFCLSDLRDKLIDGYLTNNHKL